jgi:hypothetical protein
MSATIYAIVGISMEDGCIYIRMVVSVVMVAFKTGMKVYENVVLIALIISSGSTILNCILLISK